MSASSLTYTPSDMSRDEVFSPEGGQRQHWQYLLESLEKMGDRAFASRVTKAERMLRDDGATYNVYSEQDVDHSWRLDLVPSLLTSEEWGGIETGLQERAELFNLLLKDLYGPRNLVRTGVIPPEAVFLHRGFLRPCQGVQMLGDQELIFHAADLARTPDGGVCILTDRTQSPSGSGYALENRTIMSRILPSIFRDSHVHRLAQYFQKMRATLNGLCVNQDQPRIVMLTPGTHNEAYFEHAYLANYLGFYLVQSGDLIVRNGYVWMKSLDGLSRVDVILRRVDDDYCDPVELNGASQLGVPNLLEVVRAGRVTIANPLGAGLLENPIFLKYLPAISQALLGRELRLPSVQTLWLGDEQDRLRVMQNIKEWVIKPIYRGNQQRSRYVAELDEASRLALLAEINAKPEQFVAQAKIDALHVPAYSEGKLISRPALLRSFSVAHGSSYAVMPGGLTRINMCDEQFAITNQLGSYSKDTWVISSEPELNATGPAGLDAQMSVKQADLISLPSRVVENLFWMGRYAERAEALLRLLRTVFVMLNGEEPVSAVCRRQLLVAVSDIAGAPLDSDEDLNEVLAEPDDYLLAIVDDANSLGSVRSNLNAMLYCAEESKELLSSDTLRVINDIRDVLFGLTENLEGGLASAPEEALDPLVTALMALSGLAHESMMRSQGWRFMQIGRRIERAYQTTVIIEQMLVPEVEENDQSLFIQALLLTLENLISYRRRYRARMGVQSCLDLVLLDTQNPRSLLFQLQSLGNHLRALPKAPELKHELPVEERAALRAQTLTQLIQLKALSDRKNGERRELKAHLTDVGELVSTVSQAVCDKYFDHKTSSQQLVRNISGE